MRFQLPSVVHSYYNHRSKPIHTMIYQGVNQSRKDEYDYLVTQD